MLFGNRTQGAPGLFAPPSPVMGTPIMAPQQDVVSPQQAFTWGQGGAQITPDEIARRRAIAQAQGKSDYSPVGHWSQGLGRVVDSLMAGLETRKLDKAAEANSEHSAAIVQALLGGNGDAASAAMVDPTLSSDVQGLAKVQWERAHPKPVNNDTSADAALYDQRLGPGKGNEYLASKLDPIVTIPTPFGPYVGRQSGLDAALAAFKGGGGPASTGSAGAPPTTLPPNFDFDKGGPGAPQPRAGFHP